MAYNEWISKRIKKGLRVVRRLPRKSPAQVTAGHPAGITRELLEDFCRSKFGKGLDSVAYSHLSGWKETGSFRLFLRMVGGDDYTLIYKNALYDLGQIPALDGLPQQPGPPEYFVYANVQGEFATYLPEIFYSKEVLPGRQFQYLMEDLGQGYRRIAEPRDRLRAVVELSSMHQALAAWLRTVDAHQLIRYDDRFSDQLLAYTHRNLAAYVRATADQSALSLTKRWAEVADVYQGYMPDERLATVAIHGDSNPANILIANGASGRFKLIDWEWAGIGIPHADLASLLKRSSNALEQEALNLYAQQNGTLSPVDHQRLYEWCQLQRGLLDIGFVTVQHLSTSHDTRVNLAKYVRKSIRRALLASERLQRLAA